MIGDDDHCCRCKALTRRSSGPPHVPPYPGVICQMSVISARALGPFGIIGAFEAGEIVRDSQKFSVSERRSNARRFESPHECDSRSSVPGLEGSSLRICRTGARHVPLSGRASFPSLSFLSRVSRSLLIVFYTPLSRTTKCSFRRVLRIFQRVVAVFPDERETSSVSRVSSRRGTRHDVAVTPVENESAMNIPERRPLRRTN